MSLGHVLFDEDLGLQIHRLLFQVIRVAKKLAKGTPFLINLPLMEPDKRL